MPRDGNELANGAGGALETKSSLPFLTDTQRAALDAALAGKQRRAGSESTSSRLLRLGSGTEELRATRSSGGKAAHADPPRSKSEQLHDRHRARSGKGSGKAKKGGAGGKYTWEGAGGALMAGDDLEVDPNDPNYDPDEDEPRRAPVALHAGHSEEVAAFKQAADVILQEYFSSGDAGETGTALQELQQSGLHHLFVKRLVARAMDRHTREREMASVLLSSLYSQVLAPEAVARGLLEAVAAVEDLRLDVPDSPDVVATFVSRAIVDEILPPSFVEGIPADSAGAAEVRRKCGVLLKGRHAAERMQRCWGAGAGLRLAETRAAVASMLKEYVASADKAEAERCLRELAVPFFHHEVVKQALLLAMEAPASQGPLLALLAHMADSGLVSGSQMHKGFQRVADGLADTCLDNPAARERFIAITHQAEAGGWLDEGVCGELAAPPASADSAADASAHSVQAFKAASLEAVREYFASSDAAEVARRLEELAEPGLQNILVKLAVQLAMDRRGRERELTSVLLAGLVPAPLTRDQLALGFTRLLASVEDMALDIPDAAHQLSLFLGRVIVDEALPPSFLTSVLANLRNDSLGVSVVQATGVALSARHAAERMLACWHSAQTTEELRDSMQALLEEYEASGDVGEAARCLRELGVPSYHHELVRRTLAAAFAAPKHAPALCALLAALASSGQITQTQMRTGFNRVCALLDDYALDYPAACTQFEEFQAAGEHEGWLQPLADGAGA
ncbi:hypothetical protein WJX81_007334 [Elliptochloris bilobata]|uniref:MI domain-containing protein n=1 Tax=Elliptochloris bilobata TaxID=381761 RepID=A0AAW1QAV7_9CHLO